VIRLGRRGAAAGLELLVLQPALGRDDARLLGVLLEELGRGAVIAIGGGGGEGADVLAVLVRHLGLAGEAVAQALGDARRADRIGRDTRVAQLLAPHETEAIARGALRAFVRLRGSALGGRLVRLRRGGRGGGCAGRGCRGGGGLLRLQRA